MASSPHRGRTWETQRLPPPGPPPPLPHGTHAPASRYPPGHAEARGFAWLLGSLASWEGPPPKAAPSPQGPAAPLPPQPALPDQAPFLLAAGGVAGGRWGFLECGLMLGSSWTIAKVTLTCRLLSQLLRGIQSLAPQGAGPEPEGGSQRKRQWTCQGPLGQPGAGSGLWGGNPGDPSSPGGHGGRGVLFPKQPA